MEKERPLIRYEKLSKEDLVDYCRVYWRRIHNDEELFNEIYKDIEKLKEENKKLHKEQWKLHRLRSKDTKHIAELEEENKKLREELEQYKKMFEDQLKEVYIKNTAKFLGKKFPKINWFTEEGTIQ